MKKILVILAFIGLSSCQEQRTPEKSVEEQTEQTKVTEVENPEEAGLKRYLPYNCKQNLPKFFHNLSKVPFQIHLQMT